MSSVSKFSIKIRAWGPKRPSGSQVLFVTSGQFMGGPIFDDLGIRRLMGNALDIAAQGSAPAFFSPGPADPIPPYDGGGGRRGNNDMMASPRGPVPSSRPGSFS